MNPSEFEQLKRAFIEEIFGHVRPSERYKRTKSIAELDAPVSPKASLAPSPLKEASLEELIDIAKNTIALGAYLRQKAHQRDMVTYRPALFEQGQISRDYWSRLLNNEMRASKEKLLRIAILLKLSEAETEEMLDLAGYSLSSTIPRDVVVQFCLKRKLYNFMAIEQLLADHEIQSLFNDRRGV
jgi:hypothetical protein